MATKKSPKRSAGVTEYGFCSGNSTSDSRRARRASSQVPANPTTPMPTSGTASERAKPGLTTQTSSSRRGPWTALASTAAVPIRRLASGAWRARSASDMVTAVVETTPPARLPSSRPRRLPSQRIRK